MNDNAAALELKDSESMDRRQREQEKVGVREQK